MSGGERLQGTLRSEVAAGCVVISGKINKTYQGCSPATAGRANVPSFATSRPELVSSVGLAEVEQAANPTSVGGKFV